LIDHVLIVNTDINLHERNGRTDRGYEILVTLSQKTEKKWRYFFAREWNKTNLKKSKKIQIKDNELRLVLLKNENIQKHLDVIKDAVYKADTYAAAGGHIMSKAT
jgi:hypothetical protein